MSCAHVVEKSLLHQTVKGFYSKMHHCLVILFQMSIVISQLLSKHKLLLHDILYGIILPRKHVGNEYPALIVL